MKLKYVRLAYFSGAFEPGLPFSCWIRRASASERRWPLQQWQDCAAL